MLHLLKAPLLRKQNWEEKNMEKKTSTWRYLILWSLDCEAWTQPLCYFHAMHPKEPAKLIFSKTFWFNLGPKNEINVENLASMTKSIFSFFLRDCGWQDKSKSFNFFPQNRSFFCARETWSIFFCFFHLWNFNFFTERLGLNCLKNMTFCVPFLSLSRIWTQLPNHIHLPRSLGSR